MRKFYRGWTKMVMVIVVQMWILPLTMVLLMVVGIWRNRSASDAATIYT
jgi:hypothetical protein